MTDWSVSRLSPAAVQGAERRWLGRVTLPARLAPQLGGRRARGRDAAARTGPVWTVPRLCVAPGRVKRGLSQNSALC